MATTSFSESLKYGGKLFGLFVLVALLGGGALGAGAYLGVPEVQSYLDTGSVDTTATAGGAALAAVGAVVLLVGQFALAYKLIADAVARGTEAETAVFDAVESGDEEVATGEEPAGGEETETTAEGATGPAAGAATGAGDDAGTGAAGPEEAAADAGTTERARGGSEPRSPAEGSAKAAGPEQSGSAAPADGAEASDESATGSEEPTEPPAAREQTAEEIAFGTREEGDGAVPDETESADGADGGGAVGAVDNDEEPPETEPERGSTETAGNPSSDPLADRFDDE